MNIPATNLISVVGSACTSAQHVITVATSMTAASVAKVAFVTIFALSVSYGSYKLCKLGLKLIAEQRAFSHLKNVACNLVDGFRPTHHTASVALNFLKTQNTEPTPDQVGAAKDYLETIPKAVADAENYRVTRDQFVSLITPLNGGPIKQDQSEALATLDIIINPLLKAVALHEEINQEVNTAAGVEQNTILTVLSLQTEKIQAAIHTAAIWLDGKKLL